MVYFLVSGGSSSIGSDLTYNQKGQLLIDGYPFVRSSIKGIMNTAIEWRCAQAKKHKCNARTKTFGKKLAEKKLTHNHEARKQKEVKAIIWNEILPISKNNK